MKARLCIDDAVGERRRCLLDADERPFRLELERWSERGRRARLYEVWWGRAVARMQGERGWFIDLGLGEAGVLETKAAITEGALAPVRIKSEAWEGKGPVLSLADMSPLALRPGKPGRHAAAEDDHFLAGVEVAASILDGPARRAIDAAVEEALSPTAPIVGGGTLHIDHTRALSVIDIDAADRPTRRPSFDFDLNCAAAEEAARQIALRGIGGLVVIDFVSMKEPAQRVAVSDRFRDRLVQRLGRASTVLGLSTLGLCEAAIARRARPVAGAFNETPPEEREALDALRMIESEGRAGPERIYAALSQQAAQWLEADAIGWKAAIADRIGARWTIRAENRPPGPPKVSRIA